MLDELIRRIRPDGAARDGVQLSATPSRSLLTRHLPSLSFHSLPSMAALAMGSYIQRSLPLLRPWEAARDEPSRTRRNLRFSFRLSAAPASCSSSSSMAAVVRGVLRGIKEKGLSNFIRDVRDEGYFKCLLDGNLLQTKIHGIGATLVGTDKFGNKYYEKLHDTQYGRHRWVEYAEKGRYNASQVPPEWHGWLHYITDSTGDKLLEQKTARYLVEHKQNFTGEGEELIYHSKGHTLNPGQRDWTRYQPWEPKKEEASS